MVAEQHERAIAVYSKNTETLTNVRFKILAHYAYGLDGSVLENEVPKSQIE